MVRDDDLHDLTRHPILAVLEPEALRFIALSAAQRILRSGEILFRRDEPSDGGYFLRSGSVVFEPAGGGARRKNHPAADAHRRDGADRADTPAGDGGGARAVRRAADFPDAVSAG